MAGGPRKKAAAKNAKVGRPAKAAAGGIDGLSGTLAAVQGSETERAQVREVLDRIQTVITESVGLYMPRSSLHAACFVEPDRKRAFATGAFVELASRDSGFVWRRMPFGM